LVNVRRRDVGDPWLFADPDGDGWHILITARANHGPTDDRGLEGPQLRRSPARRALNRHSSDVVYKRMLHDAETPGAGKRAREDTRERLCNPARTA
jgi:hypothetical protein